MSKLLKIIQKNSEKLLIESFIKIFKELVLKQEKLNKRFSFVMTGGKSPINLYKSLSKLNIDWKNIDFFWADERFISQTSKHSNFKLIKQNLLKNIKIKKKQIFFIDTKKKSAFLAAKDYEKKIKTYFNQKNYSFDLVLLGMGNDGHIASIFPEDKEILNRNITRNVYRSDFDRITIGLDLINKSKKICLWLPTIRKSRRFDMFKKIKKKPINYLKKNSTEIFSIRL